MKLEQMYDIARYDPQSDAEDLVERARLSRKADSLWYGTPEGAEIRCDSQETSVAIERYPALREVRPNQITRIDASDEAMQELPRVLHLVGKPADLDRSLWSDALWTEHVGKYYPEDYPDDEITPVLYVNGYRWGAWPLVDGHALLPFDDELREPRIQPRWAHISFTECGSMTSGIDASWIGPVTPRVIAAIVRLDEEPTSPLCLRSLLDGPAEAIVEWLLDGGLASPFFAGEHAGQRLLAQLFVEAAVGEFNGREVPGSLLVGRRDANSQFMMDSSEWTLTLDLEPQVVAAVLSLMALRSPQLADIVEACRQPESAAGRRRREYTEYWASQHE